MPIIFPRSVIGRPNGDIWINNYGGNGTLGTVRQYTAAGQLLRRINTYNAGLPDYFIDHIKRDSTGNMWFAGGEGGLSRMLGSNGAPDAATHWRNWSNHNDRAEPYPWAGNDADVFRFRRCQWHLLDGRQRCWSMGLKHRPVHGLLELAELEPRRAGIYAITKRGRHDVGGQLGLGRLLVRRR